MIRKAFVLSVDPAARDEYKRRHAAIWPELAETLTRHGVHNYSIFLHPETHQLFGYVEVESEERWNAIADTEVCRRWWAFISESRKTPGFSHGDIRLNVFPKALVG